MSPESSTNGVMRKLISAILFLNSTERPQTEHDRFLKCSHRGASFATGSAPVNHNAHHSNKAFHLPMFLYHSMGNKSSACWHLRWNCDLQAGHMCFLSNSAISSMLLGGHVTWNPVLMRNVKKPIVHICFLIRLILRLYSRGTKAKKHQLPLSPDVKRSMHGLTIGCCQMLKPLNSRLVKSSDGHFFFS